MKRFVQDHRSAVIITSLILTALAVFVVVWFQPQKLFVEQTVDEGVPSVADGPGSNQATPIETPSDPTPDVLLSGTFSGLEHETSGRAKVVELSDGRRFLRFEDLATSNGPDLRVYLSEIPASNDWHAYGERFIDLGPLKGNIGNQNYEIPPEADLSRYESAVIWCRRFTVGFGVAGLS